MRRDETCVLKTAAWMLGVLTLTSALTSVRAQEPPATEEEAEPRWQGKAGLAFLLTSGNTETESLGVDLYLVRKPDPWGLELNAQLQRAEDGGVRTAERYLLSLRGTRAVTEHWEVFAGALGEQDEFAGLELRTLVEAGFVTRAFTGPKHHLAFDLGLSWTDEDRVPPEPDTDSVGAIAGVAYEWEFSETASFTERLIYHANFDDSDDWRVDSTTALSASLSARWALQLSYELRYRNRPIGDRDDTDATTKASLVVKL